MVARCRVWWSDTYASTVQDTWFERCQYHLEKKLIWKTTSHNRAVRNDAGLTSPTISTHAPRRLNENDRVDICSPETISCAFPWLLRRVSCSRMGTQQVATGTANFVVQRSTYDLPAEAKRRIMLLQNILVGSGVRALTCVDVRCASKRRRRLLSTLCRAGRGGLLF